MDRYGLPLGLSLDDLPPISSSPSGYYTYSTKTGLQLDGVSLQNPERIRSLLVPDLAKGKRAVKAATAEAAKLTKNWYTAQFQFYQVPYDKKATVVQMAAEMKAAVKAGKFDVLPPDVAADRASLAATYTAENSAHLAAKNQLQHEAFMAVVRTGGPAAAAQHDVRRFVHHYFLDADGMSLDPAKAPAALALPGADRASVRGVAAKLGLFTQSGGKGSGRVIVIGANANAVRAAAHRIDATAEVKRKASVEIVDDEQMAEHREFVAAVAAVAVAVEGEQGQPLGEYLIKCKSIESDYPNDCGEGLTLHIRWDQDRGGAAMAGDFEFGILEGMMRFWGEGEEPPIDVEAAETGGKRKRAGTMIGKPLKRSAGASGRKLQFLWRGRETDEGEIEVDCHGTNKGTIEFTDDTFTRFVGTFNASLLEQDCKFEGFKVADEEGCAGVVNRWEDFSQEAYERECIGRWR